jgi:tyrosinase
LQKKPSVFAAGVVPGSKSLYDDFVFVHLNQTVTIHLTVRLPETPSLGP